MKRKRPGSNSSPLGRGIPLPLGTEISIVTLGCPKNLVDSEHLAFLIERAGYRVVRDPEDARSVILNTCGFLRDAEDEAYQVIEELLYKKRRGTLDFLAVGGCLYQRPGNSLEKEFPEVDLFFGHDDIPRLPFILKGKVRPRLKSPPSFLPEGRDRFPLTPPYYAYLKISEGCNRRCSFCTIPSIRGNLRSKREEALIEEARSLVESGVKEIILVAQDLTQYGWDLRERNALSDLLIHLGELGDALWLRLLYLHPVGIKRELVRILKESKNVLPYLEVPIQHISDSVLRRMRRAGGRKAVLNAIRWIREEIPEVYLRTEVIVGFPGEKESDFEELLLFLEEEHFERIGVFKFSPEPGTPASRLRDKEDEDTIEERFEIISTLSFELMADAQRRLIGKEVDILVEEVNQERAFGRTPYDSPEIDLRVVVERGGSLEEGQVVRGRVKGVSDLDLVVELK